MAVFLKEKVRGSLIENDGMTVETSCGFDFVLGSRGRKNGINRGYYMARRYEISLRVLKNIFSTREEKFRISKRPCNVLFII